MLDNVTRNETSKIKRHILQNVLLNGKIDTQTAKAQKALFSEKEYVNCQGSRIRMLMALQI